MARMVTYECKRCGTKVVVTEKGGSGLQPIYCCGMEVAEVDAVRRQLGAKEPKISGKKGKGRAGKTAAKKTVSKTKRSARAKATPGKKVSKKK